MHVSCPALPCHECTYHVPRIKVPHDCPTCGTPTESTREGRRGELQSVLGNQTRLKNIPQSYDDEIQKAWENMPPKLRMQKKYTEKAHELPPPPPIKNPLIASNILLLAGPPPPTLQAALRTGGCWKVMSNEAMS